jgi:hypothetical protein
VDLPGPSISSPRNFGELFAFYNTHVKFLYSLVQCEGALPVELLFEINAAFDHLSRHWVYEESEEEAVGKSFGHLKRCCLDVFKINVREARRQYDELRKLDTSVIDNGEFDKKLNALFSKISDGAVEARSLEGKGDTSGIFGCWYSVLTDCLRLDREFFHHPAVDWNKGQWWHKRWELSLVTLILAFVAGSMISIAVYMYFDELIQIENTVFASLVPFVITFILGILINIVSKPIIEKIDLMRKRNDTKRSNGKKTDD